MGIKGEKVNKHNVDQICKVLYWSIFMISLTIIIIYTCNFVMYTCTLQQGISNLDKMSSLTAEYQVSWLYSCPSYVSAFYNCQRDLQFMNLTGQYCNGTIVCENKYIISNRTK